MPVKYTKQAMIIRHWLDVQPKVCVISGWRRTGKTNIGAYLGICWLLGKVNPMWPGSRAMGIMKEHKWDKKGRSKNIGLIGGASLDHVERVLLEMYRNLLPADHVKKWFSIQHHSMEMHDGSSMLVRSYDQKLEAWKSGAYGLIHLDEEPPLDRLNECLSRTSTTDGKIIITVAVDDADVSYLPDACTNPMKFFGTDSFMHYKIGTEDVPDDIISQSEKERIFKQYDGTPFESAVRKGEFAWVSGKWWPEFDPKVHVIKPFEIPIGWRRFRAIDAGVAAPTACVWGAVDPRGNVFIYREYYKTGTTIEQRCRDIIELSGNRREREDGIWVERECGERYETTQLDYHEFKTDSVTGDGLDYEYVRSGINVQPSTTLGQEARRDMARKFLWVDKADKHVITGADGAPRIYFFDTCANLIWEAGKKAFKKASSDKSGTVERKVDNKDDHLMDTVEYICAELSWLVQEREMV